MAENAGSGSDDDQLVSIHEAAENFNVSQLRRALAAGASPNSTNGAGQPVIIDFCYLLPRNYNQEARMACLDLLRQSPDFDVKDSIDPYLQRVKAAGSFANYARNHLVTLTEMLTPRRGSSSPLRRVPPEVLRKIAAFAFHVGNY